MNTEIKISLKNMFLSKYILTTVATAVCFSIFSYIYNGIFAHSLAMFGLFFLYDFVMRLFEIKQDLRRKPLWKAPEVPVSFGGRVIQSLLVTAFWGAFMYLAVWSDDIRALMIAAVTFWSLTFLSTEWSARNRKSV